MALLYPWATKEYILEKMSFGQLIMYYNLGMDSKYPSNKEDGPEKKYNYENLMESKKEMLELGLIDKPIDTMRERYGVIDGTA